MIPLRLELKNFMSYGEDISVLDLSDVHTVCLSGENGHGKSALLDAMTWALWGESRAGKNRHDELIRKGADEMSVQFTFKMDGQVYRVIRKRSKRAAGSLWELQQMSDEGGGWRSLTGNTAGETEKAIQKLLRMSYDTFLNSAYLRQGQADQFVRQPPGKRKEILADILDLSRYDQLEAKAREKSRDAAAGATDLEREIHLVDAELAAEPRLRESLLELTARLQLLRDQQDSLKSTWETLQDRKGRLDGQKQFADALKAQVAGLETDLRSIAEELAEHHSELSAVRSLLVLEDEICRDYQHWMTVRQEVSDLEENLARWNKGQQMLAAAEREWQTIENEVRSKADQAVRDHDLAVNRVRDYPMLEKKHAVLAPRVAEAETLKADQNALVLQREALEKRFHALREENAVLDVEIRQWQTRLEALSQQRGVCEVCSAPLSPSRVSSVQADYDRQLVAAQDRRSTLRAQAAGLRDEIGALKQREAALEHEIDARQIDAISLGQLDQQRLLLEEIQKDLPNLAALRESTTRLLTDRQFAPEVSARVEKYKTHLARLEGVEARYTAAKSRLQALDHAERRHLELAHAQRTVRDTEMRHSRASATQAQRMTSLATVQAQLAALPDVENEFKRLMEALRQVREQENARLEEERRVTRDIGSREDALQRLDGLQAGRAEKEKQAGNARREQEVYDQLTKAFGKKGVQALIIENAIPELQEEANRLLERLTDGDMSLHFDTVRLAKAKKDAPIETLDIVVSDSYGARQLEMYSGGEGFRAALALRIALSKLLARRAGARLQTLIIDEGFGTQDGKGREKLVEALDAIKNDFEKIIVITHIDELKDAFAARIEVIKTPSGSQIAMVEGAAG